MKISETLSTYMDHTMPEAFVGLEKKARQCWIPAGNWGAVCTDPDKVTDCPKCSGFGGWILTPNAYGDGRHFKASCNNCNGWGWVQIGSPDAKCVHEWDGGKNVGNCLNDYTCRKCGHVHRVDSSD